MPKTRKPRFFVRSLEPELPTGDRAARSTKALPLGSAPGQLSSAIVPLITTELFTAEVTADILLDGKGRAGHATLVLAARMPRPAVVGSFRLAAGDLLVYGPDASFAGVQPAGSQLFLLAVPFEAFATAAAATTGRPRMNDTGCFVVTPAPSRRAALEAVVHDVVAMARAAPEKLDEDHRAAIERRLLDAWLAALERPERRGRRDSSAKRTDQIARRLDHWLETCDIAQPSVPEMCAAVHVTRRTLERALLTARGLGPAEYVRRIALNTARIGLLDPAQRSSSIAVIAMKHGFWHVGRFAGYYKETFGESPSATRRLGRDHGAGRPHA